MDTKWKVTRIETDPSRSQIIGRNGDRPISAIEVWDDDDGNTFIHGINKKGKTIRGGLFVPQEVFMQLCQKWIVAPDLLAACHNAVNRMDDSPVQACGEWQTGLFCGLEDRNITDRYDACMYGYDKALERVQEWIIDEIEAAIEKAEAL